MLIWYNQDNKTSSGESNASNKANIVNPLKATSIAFLVTGLIDLKDATISLFPNLFRSRCVMPNKITTSVKKGVHMFEKNIDKSKCVVANVTRLTSRGWHTVFTTILGTFSVSLRYLNHMNILITQFPFSDVSTSNGSPFIHMNGSHPIGDFS